MAEMVPGKKRAGVRDGSRPEADPSGRPDDKGAMRDPAQMPGGEQGELGQVQKALEELEKEKGDWSKGGG